ncbi:MAG: glycoside hydrolase family 2 TIM barrel-domain containing protein [Treponema sp.]
MTRIILPLWQDWEFAERFDERYINKGFDDGAFTRINLPHTVKEVPYNYFDEKIYQIQSCYRKTFSVPVDLEGQRIFIDFEGVMCFAKVFINGRLIGEHKGGYTPFSFDITDSVVYGENQENLLTVFVDSAERPDVPPFGGAVDYLCYGGIYREVQLRAVPQCFIKSVHAQPAAVLEPQKNITVEVVLAHGKREHKQIEVCLCLFDSKNKKQAEQCTSIDMTTPSLAVPLTLEGLKGIKLWTLEKPELYRVEVSLRENGEITDTVSVRTGFRTAVFTPDGFFLNGKRLTLRGLNRHQSFPYSGYAMPKRVQQKDADILKYELGLNIVRTSHYPQSPHFLDRCDEIGLLVFEEMPGWQHIGDSAWQDVSCKEVKEMIIRDRNHPSIILWGVRINESLDCREFYQRTNAIARELDPHRQTGGVRYLEKSEFFEDVYTMNDFIYGSPGHNTGKQRPLRPQEEVTGQEKPVPYLVTEFAGHIYPTKRFDQEERLIEHADRHLTVQNAAALDPRKCGAIGWCAFDYNTHANFGSGDRICYHGVMDMFRIPKFAASVYASQMPPEQRLVLEPLTRYTIGERSAGGISPLMICTNCTAIRLTVGGKDLGRYYPAYDRYPGLAHPPVIIGTIHSIWGGGWDDAVFTGYLGDTECISRRFVCNPLPASLTLEADDRRLSADMPDAVRCVVKLLDQAGNELPFSTDIVRIRLKGPAQIIGPQEFALIGGVRGFWIKTLGKAGTVKVSAYSDSLSSGEIVIRVR